MNRQAAKADFAQAVVEVEEAARLAVDTIRAERALADALAAAGRELFVAFVEGGYTEDGDEYLLDAMRDALARYREART